MKSVTAMTVGPVAQFVKVATPCARPTKANVVKTKELSFIGWKEREWIEVGQKL